MSGQTFKSRWLHHNDMEPRDLSPEVNAFEEWLTANHYELAVDVCPHDEGEFLFARAATDVLGDYLPELPPEMDDPAIQDALFRYACELGEISNFQHQADEDHEKELDAQFDDDDPPEID